METTRAFVRRHPTARVGNIISNTQELLRPVQPAVLVTGVLLTLGWRWAATERSMSILLVLSLAGLGPWAVTALGTPSVLRWTSTTRRCGRGTTAAVGWGTASGPHCRRDRKSTRLNSSHANISYA